MRKFNIYHNWYGNENLYEKEIITIKDGITVLVGCNGSGKTTLIRQIQSRLDEKNIPYISFNNLIDGGHYAIDHALNVSGNTRFAATALSSSEGENILLSIGEFAAKAKKAVLKAEKIELKELWIFLDAADSGLSIDNVVYLKQLFELIQKDCEKRSITVYILASANEYMSWHAKNNALT